MNMLYKGLSFSCVKHYVNHIFYLLEVKTEKSVEARIAVLGPVLFQRFETWSGRKVSTNFIERTYSAEPCSHNTTEKENSNPQS